MSSLQPCRQRWASIHATSRTTLHQYPRRPPFAKLRRRITVRPFADTIASIPSTPSSSTLSRLSGVCASWVPNAHRRGNGPWYFLTPPYPRYIPRCLQASPLLRSRMLRHRHQVFRYMHTCSARRHHPRRQTTRPQIATRYNTISTSRAANRPPGLHSMPITHSPIRLSSPTYMMELFPATVVDSCHLSLLIH